MVVLLGLSLLSGCAGRQDGAQPEPLAKPLSASEAAKVVARSVWGVVPEAPRYKKDLRPELIRGSAVAISPDTLLVSCRVVGQLGRVGLVRHQKYYMADVAPAGPESEVCLLHETEAPLEPVSGQRGLGQVELGEPVYALLNRDTGHFTRLKGELTGRRVGETRFETSMEMTAGSESAVLFDGYGNFLGLAIPGPVREVQPSGQTGAGF